MLTKLHKPFLKFVNDREGTSIVEFAVISPVMFTLLFGGFDFGHTLYMQSVLQGAINKAAREAVVAAWRQASLSRRPARALVVASRTNQLLLVAPHTGMARLGLPVALQRRPAQPAVLTSPVPCAARRVQAKFWQKLVCS